jgi:hypothetical protein
MSENAPYAGAHKQQNDPCQQDPDSVGSHPEIIVKGFRKPQAGSRPDILYVISYLLPYSRYTVT